MGLHLPEYIPAQTTNQLHVEPQKSTSQEYDNGESIRSLT